MPKIDTRYSVIGAVAKMTDCMCPKCGKKYRRSIYWTGYTVPKIFCNVCRISINQFNNDEPSIIRVSVII